MHVKQFFILAAAATAASAAILPPQVRSINGTERAVAKVFSISEWSDRGCSQNQNSWALYDKKCYEPSSTSKSLEIWYMDPGCKRKNSHCD